MRNWDCTRLLMHMISRKRLLEAAKKFLDADGQLDAWYRIAKSAEWKSIAEVRRTYSHADGVEVGDVVYTVFNIGGNKYRLITEINYRSRTIFLRHVLTHEDYDTEDWKK